MADVEKESFTSLLEEARSISKDYSKNNILTKDNASVEIKYDVNYITRAIYLAASNGQTVAYIYHRSLKYSSWSKLVSEIEANFPGFVIYQDSYTGLITLGWS